MFVNNYLDRMAQPLPTAEGFSVYEFLFYLFNMKYSCFVAMRTNPQTTLGLNCIPLFITHNLGCKFINTVADVPMLCNR